MFTKFLSHRADQFLVLRRKPLEGFDISFLILSQHLETMERDALVDFILLVIEEIDKEIKDMKLNLNTQLRAASLAYMQQRSHQVTRDAGALFLRPILFSSRHLS